MKLALPVVPPASRRAPRLFGGAILASLACAAPAGVVAGEGAFSARGYIHYDLRDFSETSSTTVGESSQLRRVRPIFEYKSPRWSARFMPDLMRETNQTLDAYLDFTPEGPWDLRVGRFKSPLSLNRLQSANALALVENSVVAAMTPNRDNGVLLGYDTRGDASWRFEAGLFDGAADDVVKGSLDRDVEWTVRALRTQPVANGTLRFGAGASGGRRHGDVGEPEVARYRTPGLSTWFRYAGDAFSDGDTGRISAFADYHGGPWFGQAEAIQSSETVRLDATRARLSHTGWSLRGSRVLTGEDRERSGIKPGDQRLPLFGVPVAVELAAHLGAVRIDQDAFRLGLAPPTSGERMRVAGVSLGLWFPRQWRLTVDYEHSRIDRPGAGVDVREKVLLTRVALAF